MPASPLVTLAKKACQRYHRRITSVAGLPYDMVRPVLLKISNAEQLHEIEKNSPQIIGKDVEIWRNLVNRDIPSSTRDVYDYEPEDPSDWYKVYKKLKASHAKKAAKDAEGLQKIVADKLAARGAPKIINPLNGPRLPGQRRGQRAAGRAPTSRAHVGKTILNDIRGDARIKKGVKGSNMWIKPSHDNSVRRSYGTVAKAPLRMIEEKTESISRAKRSEQHKYATNASANSTTKAARPIVSIVEQRRQANERLKNIGLKAKEGSDSKGSVQQQTRSANPPPSSLKKHNVFMSKKKLYPG